MVVQSSHGAVSELEVVVLSLIGPTAEDEIVEDVHAQVAVVVVDPPIGPTSELEVVVAWVLKLLVVDQAQALLVLVVVDPPIGPT